MRYFAGMLLLGATTLVSYSHAIAQSDPNAGPPRLPWLEPKQGGRVVGRQFTLIMRAEGDPTGPLSTLDHFHYNVAPLGQASENPGKFTTRNTTGIEDVNIDTALGYQAEPGTYEACSYMATVVHAKITEPTCVTFKLVFSGVNIDSPREGETLRDLGSQGIVSLFGEPGIAVIRFQIDNGAAQSDTSGQGVLNFPALNEGEHVLTAWGVDAQNRPFGDSASVHFAVRSRLSYATVQDVQSNVQASILMLPAQRLAALETLLDPVTVMSQGGKKDKNPLHKQISTKNAKKLLSALRSAFAKASSPKYPKYAKKVLKITSTMLRS